MVGLGALAAGGAAVWLTWPAALGRLTGYMGQGISGATTAGGAEADAGANVALTMALDVLVELVGPVLVAAFAGALAMGLAQSRGVFALAGAGGPEQGAGRGILPWGLARTGRGILFIAGGATLIWVSWRLHAPALFQLPAPTPMPTLDILSQAAAHLILALLLLIAALAALDYLFRWLALRQALARTPAQARRDLREHQGDPSWRGERRRMHRAMVLSNGLQAVRSRARLVVTGPGLAVVLEYRQGEMAAPRVLLTGRGEAVAPLLKVAWEARVPVAHRPDLAASLETLGEGRLVPPELYRPLAQILSLS